MVRAIEVQASKTAVTALSFDDRLTLLVQREVAWRDDGRVAWLLKAARPKVSAACVEDIDWRASRGLDRGLVVTQTGGDWLRHSGNLLNNGATGSGKTWLAGLRAGASRCAQRVLCATCARPRCSMSCRSHTATAASHAA